MPTGSPDNQPQQLGCAFTLTLITLLILTTKSISNWYDVWRTTDWIAATAQIHNIRLDDDRNFLYKVA